MQSIIDATDLRSVGSTNLAGILWKICFAPLGNNPDEIRSAFEFQTNTMVRAMISPFLKLLVQRIKEDNIPINLFDPSDSNCRDAAEKLSPSLKTSLTLPSFAFVITEFEDLAVSQYHQIVDRVSFDRICFDAVEAAHLFEMVAARDSFMASSERVGQYGPKLFATMKRFGEIVAEKQFEHQKHMEATAAPEAFLKCPSELFLNKCYSRGRLEDRLCLDMLSWMLQVEFGSAESEEWRAARRAHVLRLLRDMATHFLRELEHIFRICVPYLTPNEIFTKDPRGRDLIENVRLRSSPKREDIVIMLESAIQQQSSS
jgi:hypothetical protein